MITFYLLHLPTRIPNGALENIIKEILLVPTEVHMAKKLLDYCFNILPFYLGTGTQDSLYIGLLKANHLTKGFIKSYSGQLLVFDGLFRSG